MRDSKSFFVIKTDLTKVYVKKCILLYYDTDTVLGFKKNFQSFLIFSSDKSSRFLFLLCESRAECLPRSSQESTYFVGSKYVSGGPTFVLRLSFV